MKQLKIAKRLKVLVLLLAVMGVLFFGGVTIYAFGMKADATVGDMLWSFVFFSWYTAILCYGVLYQFWKVCNEIGKDNSFSMENAKSFHTMGILGIAAGVGYLVRLAYLLGTGCVRIEVVVYSVFMMLLSAAFYILCEALSQLIRNAYEMKQENELTI